METPTAEGSAAVMGVSRSGRVRKKSSKLMDFQSPDDIETRKRNSKVNKIIGGQLHSMSTPQPLGLQQQLHSPPLHVKMEPPLELMASPSGGEDDMQIDATNWKGANTATSSGEEMDSSADDSEIDNMSDQELKTNNTGDDGGVDPTVRKSIYMSEKSSNKNFMKDGKLMVKKTHRKDKGKSRLTAYMLWSKQARQDMLQSNPNIDFPTMARRLGEMWANVPNSEKYTYKRKAKRLSGKGVVAMKPGKVVANVTNSARPSNKFLNRKGGKQANEVSVDIVSTTIGDQSPSPTKVASSGQSSGGGVGTVGKVTDARAVDVAAHLKLLGDNLTIIGERLKEHEGQITVSGSLSVLLDSLLCSLAPLMCLTNFVPEMTGDQKFKRTLANTLDNIAYVMPGL